MKSNTMAEKKTRRKPILLKTDLSFDEALRACLMTKPIKKRKKKTNDIKGKK